MGGVASLVGGMESASAMRKVKKNLKSQLRENEDWYNRRYNEDSTQRADAQRILGATEASIRNRNRQAAGAAAVTGGTEESLAAAKEKNALALSDAVSRIAVGGDARKDNIETNYRNRDASLEDKLNDMEINKAQNFAKSAGGVAQAAENISGLF